MRILITIFTYLTFLLAQSYAQHHHFCTTPHEPLIERVDANKAYAKANEDKLRTADTKYIPIKFHLVGRSEGNGYLSFSSLLDNLCRFNQDYEKIDMIGYINDGVNYVDNSGVYEQPSTPASRLKMRQEFDFNSVNVFVTSNVDDGDGLGTTLGYYDPQEDWLVIRQAEFIDSTVTLSHEMGHFFSLMHPFFGWEIVPYNPASHGNPVDIFFTEQFNIPIEVANGSNCTTAGDRICDTPPSYLFPFATNVSLSPCELVTEVYDSNLDLVEPMENNIMDYFLDCDVFAFSPNQALVMESDFESPSRSYIRDNYVPNTAKITEAPELFYPLTGELVEAYNSVYFDWSDVANADMYLVEVQDVFGGTITEYFTTGSSLWLTDLEPNKKYAYFVHPYNETNACFKTNKVIFDTGSAVTSIDAISEIDKFAVYPNPGKSGSNITLAIEGNSQLNIDLEILNITGQSIFAHRDIPVSSGQNTYELSIPLVEGSYLVRLNSERGSLTERLIIQ